MSFSQPGKTTKDCDKEFDTLTNREIYSRVDSPPTLIGGMNKLYSELGTIKLPKDPETEQIKIFISFVVEPNGGISDLKIAGKTTSKSLDKELLELFKKYAWTPGTCNGEKVPTRLVLTVKS